MWLLECEDSTRGSYSVSLGLHCSGSADQGLKLRDWEAKATSRREVMAAQRGVFCEVEFWVHLLYEAGSVSTPRGAAS